MSSATDPVYIRVRNAEQGSTHNDDDGENENTDAWLYVHFDVKEETYVTKKGEQGAAVFKRDKAHELLDLTEIDARDYLIQRIQVN